MIALLLVIQETFIIVDSKESLFSQYRGADKSSALTTSRCVLFDGENISFYASLVIYVVIIFLQL